MLSSWTIYVLIASALVGFVLQQSALRTGVPAPAIAASNSVTLFASILLGVTVVGETISRGTGHLAPAIIGLAGVFVGIVRVPARSLRSGRIPSPSARRRPDRSRWTDRGAVSARWSARTASRLCR